MHVHTCTVTTYAKRNDEGQQEIVNLINLQLKALHHARVYYSSVASFFFHALYIQIAKQIALLH